MIYTKTLLHVGLFTVLVTLAVCDHRTNRLPDVIVIPLCLVGLLVNLNSLIVPLPDAVTGAVGGYLAIRLMHDAGVLIRGCSGIGMGDAKLLGAVGAWYGWYALPFLVVGAAIFTLAIYPSRAEKPFGVGLAVGAVGMGLWSTVTASGSGL